MTPMIPPPAPITVRRPGVVNTLGLCNIVFAIGGFLCIGWSGLMVYALSRVPNETFEIKVQAGISTTPLKTGATPLVAPFNPFAGMTEPRMIQFSIADGVVGLVINGLMFATGIGLINRRRWAANWWVGTAWFRIVSCVVLWGYFIVGVSPSLSVTTAQEIMKQFAAQNIPAGRGPDLAFLTRVYSISYLIMALGMMLFLSIYPAISLWLLSRPGVKAAIIDPRTTERNLP
jgi:hypothetical protein